MLDLLPIEILENILLRLPYKTIFRMRCVSKRYSSLTKNPYFIDQVVLKLPKTRKLMFCGSMLFSLDYNASLPKIHVEINHSSEIMREAHSIRIWGHCDGFLCLTHFRSGIMFLWNPYTRESRTVPDTPTYKYLRNPMNPLSPYMYMIGYDAGAREFIVVSVVNYGSCLQVDVYSSRKNSWRRMPNIPYTLKGLAKKGYFIDGSFYFAASRYNYTGDVIVNYHFETGKFVEVPLPNCVHEHGTEYNVLSLDGDLCVLCAREISNACSLLVKKHDATEVWTELTGSLSITYLPLSYINNGEGLLLCDAFQGLYVYDLKSRSTSLFGFQDSHSQELFKHQMANGVLWQRTTFVENVLPLCSG